MFNTQAIRHKQTEQSVPVKASKTLYTRAGTEHVCSSCSGPVCASCGKAALRWPVTWLCGRSVLDSRSLVLQTTNMSDNTWAGRLALIQAWSFAAPHLTSSCHFASCVGLCFLQARKNASTVLGRASCCDVPNSLQYCVGLLFRGQC